MFPSPCLRGQELQLQLQLIVSAWSGASAAAKWYGKCKSVAQRAPVSHLHVLVNLLHGLDVGALLAGLDREQLLGLHHPLLRLLLPGLALVRGRRVLDVLQPNRR